MSKTELIKQWIEVYNGSMEDNRDGRHEYYLFVNHCEVRRSTKQEYVTRVSTVEFIRGDSDEELLDKFLAFIKRDNVRLLTPDIQCNTAGCDVPKREPLRPSLLDGTDPIYQRDTSP